MDDSSSLGGIRARSPHRGMFSAVWTSKQDSSQYFSKVSRASHLWKLLRSAAPCSVVGGKGRLLRCQCVTGRSSVSLDRRTWIAVNSTEWSWGAWRRRIDCPMDDGLLGEHTLWCRGEGGACSCDLHQKGVPGPPGVDGLGASCDVEDAGGGRTQLRAPSDSVGTLWSIHISLSLFLSEG